jgi:hypothetical protein
VLIFDEDLEVRDPIHRFSSEHRNQSGYIGFPLVRLKIHRSLLRYRVW